MFNKLLNGLVLDFLAKYTRVPFENSRFLKGLHNYHTGFQKARPPVRDVCDKEIQELKLKLRSEADDLEKAHNEFGRILNSVNHGFFSRDMIINNYTYLSLACEKIYGYTSEEFFENSHLWYEVILPEDRGVVEKDDERLNEKEEVYTQYRIIHKDKSIRWIEVTIVPFFKNEKLIRVDGVVNDITERKRVEAEREMLLKEMTKNNADLKQFS